MEQDPTALQPSCIWQLSMRLLGMVISLLQRSSRREASGKAGLLGWHGLAGPVLHRLHHLQIMQSFILCSSSESGFLLRSNLSYAFHAGA